MCNITNEMIQECIYSTLTKTDHFHRQIKIKLIIFFFCACMKYLALNSIYISVLQWGDGPDHRLCYEGHYIIYLFIYLFWVLRRFQHCTGHIMTGSWKGRGNQYIQFVRVLYCKLLTNGKQLPAFPLEAVPGTEPQPQRWEARVLLLTIYIYI